MGVGGRLSYSNQGQYLFPGTLPCSPRYVRVLPTRHLIKMPRLVVKIWRISQKAKSLGRIFPNQDLPWRAIA